MRHRYEAISKLVVVVSKDALTDLACRGRSITHSGREEALLTRSVTKTMDSGIRIARGYASLSDAWRDPVDPTQSFPFVRLIPLNSSLDDISWRVAHANSCVALAIILPISPQ